MKLTVIVRTVEGEFWAGILKGNLKTYPGVVCKELLPQSLVFEPFKKITKKGQVLKVDDFLSLEKFRKKMNGRVPVKFSQVVLDMIGFDRVWVHIGSKL